MQCGSVGTWRGGSLVTRHHRVQGLLLQNFHKTERWMVRCEDRKMRSEQEERRREVRGQEWTSTRHHQPPTANLGRGEFLTQSCLSFEGESDIPLTTQPKGKDPNSSFFFYITRHISHHFTCVGAAAATKVNDWETVSKLGIGLMSEEGASKSEANLIAQHHRVKLPH